MGGGGRCVAFQNQGSKTSLSSKLRGERSPKDSAQGGHECPWGTQIQGSQGWEPECSCGVGLCMRLGGGGGWVDCSFMKFGFEEEEDGMAPGRSYDLQEDSFAF